MPHHMALNPGIPHAFGQWLTYNIYMGVVWCMVVLCFQSPSHITSITHDTCHMCTCAHHIHPPPTIHHPPPPPTVNLKIGHVTSYKLHTQHAGAQGSGHRVGSQHALACTHACTHIIDSHMYVVSRLSASSVCCLSLALLSSAGARWHVAQCTTLVVGLR
jgi:hypothetical protein